MTFGEAIATLWAKFWRFLLPWYVVPEYERGVRLWFGVCTKVLGPGFHWICPLGAHRVLTDNVVTAPGTVLPPQSLRTADGTQGVVVPLVSWRISDVRVFLLEVEGRDAVLAGCVAGELALAVSRAPDWATLTSDEFLRAWRRRSRVAARQYGIEIERVGYQSCTDAHSVRLWTGGEPPSLDTWQDS